MEGLSERLSFDDITHEYIPQENPNYSFLDSTLIPIVRRHSRSKVVFFSVRSWRKPIKPLQISAMRNLKQRPDEAAVQAIAREIAGCASTITNGKPYEFVCAVPGGSSSKKENFASLVARFVARELGVAYRTALETVATGGGSSSHPRQSAHFRARCTDRFEGRLGLLVDDVTTSGAHFANCVGQFRRRETSVVCVSWIG